MDSYLAKWHALPGATIASSVAERKIDGTRTSRVGLLTSAVAKQRASKCCLPVGCIIISHSLTLSMDAKQKNIDFLVVKLVNYFRPSDLEPAVHVPLKFSNHKMIKTGPSPRASNSYPSVFDSLLESRPLK